MVEDVTTDPLALIAEVHRSTTRFLATAADLDAAALADASLLPGWSRGHVLAHVARNADGCTNLLTWARTGVVTPQYPSRQRRAADIEAGAGRLPHEQLADLKTSAARFADAVNQMPAAAWATMVRWLNGDTIAATGVVWTRLREVEVHHVDLAVEYGPADWREAFIRQLLQEMTVGFGGSALAVRLRATDLGLESTIGSDPGAPVVSGPGYMLTAWLTGRSRGEGLTTVPGTPLPAVPTWK
jgi:maleylpyruvate isomerase